MEGGASQEGVREEALARTFKAPNGTSHVAPACALPAQQSLFRVHPPAAEFEVAEAGKAHLLKVRVTNLSSRRQEIRVVQPKTAAFSVASSDPKGRMAPGLSVTLAVRFHAERAGDYHDRIVLRSKSGDVEIPVRAFRPRPRLAILDGPHVDFGAVALGTTAEKTVTVVNRSGAAGEFDFSAGEGVCVEPQSGTVQAGGRVRVRLTLDAHAAGAFRAVGRLRGALGDAEHVSTVDISANVVEQRLELMAAAGGVLSDVFFGAVHYGQTRSVTFRVVNSGPSPMPVRLRTADLKVEEEASGATPTPGKGEPSRGNGGGGGGGGADDDDDPDGDGAAPRFRVPEISLHPAEAIVPPYGSVTATVKFEPRLAARPLGFTCLENGKPRAANYRLTAVVDANDGAQVAEFPVTGRGVEATLHLSRQSFEFGDVAVGRAAASAVTLHNRSPDLPVRFRFGRAAHFAVVPASGVLPAMQSRTVEIRFVPKSVGAFRTRLSVAALGAGGVEGRSLPLVLSGRADEFAAASLQRTAERSRPPGPDRVPEDFTPELVRVAPDTVRSHRRRPRFRRKDAARPDLSKGVCNPDMTYTDEELVERLEHRRRYDDWLKAVRKDRERAAVRGGSVVALTTSGAVRSQELRKRFDRAHGLDDQVDVDPEDPTSLGLAFASGMRSPRPELPDAVETVWLQRPMGGYPARGGLPSDGLAAADGAGSSSGAGKRPRPVGRRFKAQPSTQAERRDCEAELTHEEQQRVASTPAPQPVEFGRVCAESRNAVSWCVTNPLDAFVLVELRPADGAAAADLAQTGPRTQVIPPGQTAGFEVVLSGAAPRGVRHRLLYTLNGHHTFSVPVTGEIVPRSLEVSAEAVALRFGPECHGFSVSEPITLTNPFSAPIEYWWTSAGSADSSGGAAAGAAADEEIFRCLPAKGTVQPGKSVSAEMIYCPPHAQKRAEQDMVLNVAGGPKRTVRLTGSLPETAVTLGTAALDFGPLCVGGTAERVVVLRNRGKNRTVFSWDDAPAGFSLEPCRGHLEPGASAEVRVAFHPPAAGEFDCSVSLMHRGRARSAKPVALALKARAVVPRVSLRESELHFGGVTIGNTESLPLTLSNLSEVAVRLTLDLSRHPQFSAAGDVEPAAGAAAGAAGVYAVAVEGGGTASFELRYRPTTEGAHEFELPLRLDGAPSCPHLRRLVAATGLKPCLALTPSRLAFGGRVVLKKDCGIMPLPYTEELVISNERADRPLVWSLVLSGGDCARDDGDDAPRPWTLSESRGELPPGGACAVSVSFWPFEARAYEQRLDVVVDGAGGAAAAGGRPYLSTVLRGEGIHPSLAFDRDHVVLEPVPLGHRAETTFTVRNCGYDNLELRAVMPKDSDRVPLELTFPDGTMLGVGRDALPVRVAFASDRPLSFTAAVEFHDAAGRAFCVTVSGTADNSLATLQDFVDDHADDLRFHAGAGQAPQLTHRPRSGRRALPRSAPSVADSIDEAAARVARLAAQVEGVTAFLQATQLLPGASGTAAEVAEAFPDQLTASRGAPAVALVEGMSGAKVQVQVSAAVSSRDEGGVTVVSLPSLTAQAEGASGAAAAATAAAAAATAKDAPAGALAEALQAEGTYQRLLTFLNGRGAMLGGLLPRDLLPHRQRAALDRHRGAAAGPGEGDYRVALRAAWLRVVCQAVRVFVMSRVTLRAYRTQSGLPAAVTARATTASCASNALSPAEALLAEWLTAHHNRAFPHTPRQVVDFAADLADGAVLAAVVQAHLPHLEERLRPATKGADDAEGRRRSVTLVLDALRETGIAYPLAPAAVADAPSARAMSLLALYLFQTLPHFVPKTTIDFQCTLLEECARSVELTNPKRRPISYGVRLERCGGGVAAAAVPPAAAADAGAPGVASCEGFWVTEETVRLEGKGHSGSTASLPVRFRGSFTGTKEARLILTSESNGTDHAQPIVFNLRATVSAGRPLNTAEVASPLYQMCRHTLEVVNPFGVDCALSVRLSAPAPAAGTAAASRAASASTAARSPKSPSAGRRKGKAATAAGGVGGSGGGGSSSAAAETAAALASLPAFFMPRDTLKLRAGATGTMELQYLPLSEGEHRAVITFSDPRAGEFSYEVVGRAGEPEAAGEVKWTVEHTGAVVRRDIPISWANQQLDRAQAALAERFKQYAQLNLAREQREAVEAAGTPSEMLKKLAGAGASQAAAGVSYAVSCAEGPFFSMPSRVRVSTPLSRVGSAAASRSRQGTAGRRRKAAASAAAAAAAHGAHGDAQPNMLPLSFTPSGPGVYRGTVLLRSAADTRALRFECKVTSKTVTTAALEFDCAARESVTQQIPVVNRSQEDWTLQASLAGGSSPPGWFSGPPSLSVPANSTREYPLTFSPDWVGVGRTQLTLAPASPDQQRLQYELTGRAGEPSADGFVRVECRARAGATRELEVRNHTRADVVLQVETDVAGVSGPAELAVPANRSAAYPLSVVPPRAGTYGGTVTFTAPGGRYQWFGLEVVADTPEPEAEIELRTGVRRAAVAEIGVENPLDRAADFRVVVQGRSVEGSSPSLRVEPGASATYSVRFAPLAAGRSQGAVYFVSEQLGEFWYRLRLEADPAEPADTPLIECVLGRRGACRFVARNPTAREVRLTAAVGDPARFSVRAAGGDGGVVTIPARGEAELEAEFAPQEAGEDVHETVCVLAHPTLGELGAYRLRGRALMPRGAELEPRQVFARLGARSTGTATFRNPLPTPLRLTATLADESGAFELYSAAAAGAAAAQSNGTGRGGGMPAVHAAATTEVPGGGTMPISFGFCPAVLTTVRAAVTVAADGHPDLRWTLPIEGVTEGPTSREVIDYSTQARKVVCEEISLRLDGLDVRADGGERMRAEVRCVDPAQQAVLDAALRADAVTTELRSPDDPMVVRVQFEPLRPMSVRADLVVMKESGGQWKFNCRFEATPCEPDDTIRLEAAMHETSAARFRLANVDDTYAPFRAFLTADSAPEFRVSPARGTLQPSGHEGAPVTVSFTPVDYSGKPLRGVLVVQTDSYEWRYSLVGAFPRYVPPGKKRRK